MSQEFITFMCASCGKSIKAPMSMIGKRGKCKCGAVNVVPEPEPLVTFEEADVPHYSSQAVVKSVKARRASVAQPREPRSRKHRVWLALFVVAALIAAPFMPKLPLWFGIVLLALCVAAFIPRVQGVSHRLLKLNPAEKWRSGLRLAMYGLISLVLVLAGWSGLASKAEEQRIAAKQAAEKAEQERLAKVANAEVVTLVTEAERAWKQGNSNRAEDKLKTASMTPNASNLSPVRQLRTRMANAEVETLTGEAIKAVKGGDIDTAKAKVKTALAVPHADAIAAARKLDEQIGNATDSTRIRAVLMDLPDGAFRELKEKGKMPSDLVSGYEGLDSRTADFCKAHIAEVAEARERRRLEKLKVEREAAEAARKAEAERKARERAAAEAKRKEERKRRIETNFSGWDGSHRGLTKVIKASMNNPKSYEHVETVYWDRGDHLIVQTTFRGTNAFGGVVTNWVKAKVDLDGNVLAVIGRGP